MVSHENLVDLDRLPSPDFRNIATILSWNTASLNAVEYNPHLFWYYLAVLDSTVFIIFVAAL